MKRFQCAFKTIFFLIFFFNVQIAYTAVIATSDIEDNGEWTIGTTINRFVDPTPFGFSPTAGITAMHFNNGLLASTGTNTITFTGNSLSAGEYTVTIDVGNYNNQPFATIGEIGMTAGGNLLTATSIIASTPASGDIVTWTYTYIITPSDTLLGQDLGFSITVPFDSTLGDPNVAFDNLIVDFVPPVLPPASNPQGIPALSTWGLGLMIILLGFFARRRT